MKRHGIYLIAFTIALSGMLGVGFSKNAVTAKATNGDVGYAEYVSAEAAPIIDGIKDDVWSSTYELTIDEGNSDVVAYVSILWNEAGLYFFAEIFDSTTNVSDRCNFWVSERLYNYSPSMIYPETEGAYYLCLNPHGENQYYLPGSIAADKYVDMTGKYQVATQVYDVEGYAIELYVPVFGNTAFTHLHSIGFNVSVDDYYTADSERESYIYWAAIGKYWENPSATAEVVLLNSTQLDTPPDDSSSGNASSDNSGNTSVDSGGDSVSDQQPSGEEGASSCFSSITLLPMVSAFSLAWVLLKKKED